jgi:hypothetical protein
MYQGRSALKSEKLMVMAGYLATKRAKSDA